MSSIEVFADVLCPFTHLGLRTLIDRRSDRGLTEPHLRIRAWPLELINGKPLDPHHIDAEITALRGSVRPDLFAGFSVDAFPSTSMAAFALTAAADRTGDPVLIEEVGIAVRNAVFEEGLDVGRSQVVKPIAARFDLEPLDADATLAAVQADWDEGRARGVIGSPHFFTDNGGNWFCPSLAVGRDDADNFVIAWKQDTEAFVDSIFG